MGIIGLPNAGKSTLISVLSAARPKIADYPFTTLVPNLGVVRQPNGDGTVFADIPGLIAGAHAGLGLGHEFLRHIERTRLLLHLIDATAEDVVAAYQTIRDELVAYGHGLGDRPQIIALNKIDALEPSQIAAVEDTLTAYTRSTGFCHLCGGASGVRASLRCHLAGTGGERFPSVFLIVTGAVEEPPRKK